MPFSNIIKVQKPLSLKNYIEVNKSCLFIGKKKNPPTKENKNIVINSAEFRKVMVAILAGGISQGFFLQTGCSKKYINVVGFIKLTKISIHHRL